jgi:hypothetical protein
MGFYHLPTFKNITQGKWLLPEDFSAISGNSGECNQSVNQSSPLRQPISNVSISRVFQCHHVPISQSSMS